MPDEPPGKFHAHPLKRKWQKEHEHPAVESHEATKPRSHEGEEKCHTSATRLRFSPSSLRGSVASWLPDYAELHCLSNFSFLRGASHPEELVLQAAALGYRAVAITDRNSLAGVVRAHVAAKKLRESHEATEPRSHEGEDRGADSSPSCLRASVPSCLPLKLILGAE